MNSLEYYDLYSKIGWKIIPLFPKSKQPMKKNWYKDFEDNRKIIEANPNCNLGLALGKIIDIESDDGKGNLILDKILKDIPHPIFKSSRSIHHLFLNRNIKYFKFKGIEFRGYRHLSVIPPSIHNDGTPYKWLKQAVFNLSHLPKALYELYNPNNLQPGHTQMKCSVCHNMKFIHKKRLGKEKKAFNELKLPWQCQKCRKIDVRPLCRKY